MLTKILYYLFFSNCKRMFHNNIYTNKAQYHWQYIDVLPNSHNLLQKKCIPINMENSYFEVQLEKINWNVFTTTTTLKWIYYHHPQRFRKYFPEEQRYKGHDTMTRSVKFWYERGLAWPFSHRVVKQPSKCKQLTNNLVLFIWPLLKEMCFILLKMLHLNTLQCVFYFC